MSAFDPTRALAELVRIPSVSGDEEAAVAWVEAWGHAHAIDSARVGGGALLRVARGRGPRLLFASHLDTVPAGGGWSGDPYDGTWREGRLVARGANDAKASAVAMLAAALGAAHERSFAGELLVALNACEETTNAGMAAVLAAIEPPDAVVVGEPTGLEVVRAQGGLAVLTARWRGRSCHAAHVARVQHASALVAAAHELGRFGSYRTLASQHPLFAATTIAWTQLQGGERHNVVPDEALAVFDARLAPPTDAARCVELLRGLLPSAEVAVRSERLRPVDTPEGHPLVRAALALAGRARALGSSTLSDMALCAGLPAIKCGPGQSERSHTPDEFVTEGELLGGCAFYERLAARLAQDLVPERVR